MPACKKCGTVVSVLEVTDGFCRKCTTPEMIKLKLEREDAKQRAKRLTEEQEAAFNLAKRLGFPDIVVSTEMCLDLAIEKRICVINTQRIYGINLVKDVFTFVRDIVGGRIESLESTLHDASESILLEFKEEAYLRGGNAVIGIKIEHTYNNANNGTILSVYASGTIVNSAQ